MHDLQVKPSFWQQFFRNIGLGVINDFTLWLRGCRHRDRKRQREHKKVVVSSSRWLAFSRCGVHILPILVSTAIIAINLQQVFIGIDFNSFIQSETINIAFLQTAAKVQELLIVASLATIIFQLTRDELLYGDGIPLGLLSAGVDFTRWSFFWSPQMLGSLRSLFKGPRKYRKIQLGIFILLAGALALLAGPSCAVLLVPQTQEWPAGGTPISLNGTMDDFWPSQLTANSLQASICSSSTGTGYGVCPSGGYHSLWSHYSGLNNSTYADTVPSYASSLSGNHYYWSIESTPPVSTKTISLGEPHPFVYIVQPHLSVSIVLDQLMKDWWNALLMGDSYKAQQIDDRQAASSYVLSPLVGVRCAPAESLSSSDHTIQFPTFDFPQRLQPQDITGSTISDTPTNHLQFSWFPLSQTFQSVTTGAVLQSAWNSDNQTRLVVGCSISAHWVPANVRADSYSFWQGWYPKSIGFGSPYPTKGGQLFNGSESTQDAIVVDQSWLNALTPRTPVEGTGNFEWSPTTIESILSSVRITEDLRSNGTVIIDDWQPQDNANRPGLLASVIASIFADGLSRAGVDKLYKTQGNPSQWSLSPYEKDEDFERLILKGGRALKYPEDRDMFHVEFAISGLNYKNTLAERLAMVVLFLHITVALAHTIWTTARGRSSACWDSITEIVVLAQNSKPAFPALENTAAGLQHSFTFAKKVIIRPTRLFDAQEADHVEFLLDEDESIVEDEMFEIPPPNLGPAKLAKSSVVEVVENSIDRNNILRPSTWPTSRRHGSAPCAHISNDPHDETLTTPAAPLLTPSNQDSRTAPEVRVKDDHAYG